MFRHESWAAFICPVSGCILGELKEACEAVRGKLREADMMLSEAALEDAQDAEVQNPRNQRRYEWYVSLAERYIGKAETRDKAHVAIIYCMWSWRYSQKAIEVAGA